MFCPNCGKKIPEKSKFCPMCGFNIKDFFDNSFNNDIEKNNNDNIEKDKKANSKLEDLFTGNTKEEKTKTEETILNTDREQANDENFHSKVSFEDIKSTINEEVDVKKEEVKFEENKTETEQDLDEEQLESDNKEKKRINKEQYVESFLKYKEKLFSKIKESQKFIYSKIDKTLENMILDKNKYKDYLVILIALVVFIPLIINMRVILSSGQIGTKLIRLGFIILTTVINVFVIAAGPYLSLRILKFNYMKNLDKNTMKSIVLISSFAIAVVNLIIYILFEVTVNMDMIISNLFSAKIVIATIISMIVEVYIIQTMVINKIKDEKYSKFTLTILLGVVVSKIISFLIAAPIISLLREII